MNRISVQITQDIILNKCSDEKTILEWFREESSSSDINDIVIDIRELELAYFPNDPERLYRTLVNSINEFSSAYLSEMSYGIFRVIRRSDHTIAAAITFKESVSHMDQDDISAPDHYVSGREYEPHLVIEDWGLDFNLGNVIKYVARAGKKEGNDIRTDLKKARQYLDFELDRLEKHNA